MAEGIKEDLGRDFWIRETGTGQQVAQLHDRQIDDDDDDDECASGPGRAVFVSHQKDRKQRKILMQKEQVKLFLSLRTCKRKLTNVKRIKHH
jgi:hypothetical protein